MATTDDTGDTTETPTDLDERFNYDESCKKSVLRSVRNRDVSYCLSGAYLAYPDIDETLLYEVIGAVPDEADVDEWVDEADQRMSISYMKLAEFIAHVTYWAYHDGYARGYGVEELTDANRRVIDNKWAEWYDREDIYALDGAPTPPSDADGD